VAGKTGTPEGQQRSLRSQQVLAAFVGIVPADNPRVVIAVMIDEPHGVHYGGVVAAPVFKEIAEATLRYLGVPPSASVVASTARPAKKGDANIATARLADADANEVEGPGVEEPVRRGRNARRG